MTVSADGIHDFGWTINKLKQGACVARKGWNGKGMYLYLYEGSGNERPYIKMKDAQDMHVPWLASQTDMLAEDWEEISCF